MRATEEWQLDGAQRRANLRGSDYLAILYTQRYIIAVVMCAFLALAVAAHFIIPEQYEGDVVMVATPADNSLQTSMNGALAGAGLGFLADSSGTGDQKAVAMATLQSRAFLQDFIQGQNLMPTLFASEWDGRDNKWKTSKPPTLEEGYNKLFSAITLDAPQTQPIVMLRVRWTDAKVASMIANSLVRRLNSQFQAKAIDEAQRKIGSLTESYPQTSIAEVRTSIANLIQEQIRQRLIAQSRDQYAMTVIDPAEPSKKKVSPGLIILLPVGLILGLVFGIPAAFLAERRKFSWRGSSAASQGV